MKEIKLTQGMTAMVDDEDYVYLKQFKWCAHKCNRSGYYAERWIKGSNKHIKMHREILNAPRGAEVDHKNHDTLDNRKCNIRLCTRSQNTCNSRTESKRRVSKYRGVDCVKYKDYSELKHPNLTVKRIRWRAGIWVNGKYIYLGLFDHENDAAIAYNKLAEQLHGEFATLNIIN